MIPLLLYTMHDAITNHACISQPIGLYCIAVHREHPTLALPLPLPRQHQQTHPFPPIHLPRPRPIILYVRTIKVFPQHGKEALVGLAPLFPAEIDGDWFAGWERGEVDEGLEEEGECGLCRPSACCVDRLRSSLLGPAPPPTFWNDGWMEG